MPYHTMHALGCIVGLIAGLSLAAVACAILVFGGYFLFARKGPTVRLPYDESTNMTETQTTDGNINPVATAPTEVKTSDRAINRSAKITAVRTVASTNPVDATTAHLLPRTDGSEDLQQVSGAEPAKGRDIVTANPTAPSADKTRNGRTTPPMPASDIHHDNTIGKPSKRLPITLRNPTTCPNCRHVLGSGAAQEAEWWVLEPCHHIICGTCAFFVLRMSSSLRCPSPTHTNTERTTTCIRLLCQGCACHTSAVSMGQELRFYPDCGHVLCATCADHGNLASKDCCPVCV